MFLFFLISSATLINSIRVPLELPDLPGETNLNLTRLTKSKSNQEDSLAATPQNLNYSSSSSPLRRFKEFLSGGHDSCFKAAISFQTAKQQAQTFSLKIDSGSSDTAIPINTLSGYTGGPTLSYTVPNNAQQVRSTYSDGSYWQGILIQDVNVSIPSSSINGKAPFYGIISQSTNPKFVDNEISNGIIGIAFSSIAKPTTSPATLIDAWFQQGLIPQNLITIHGCPYTLATESWIDFGNRPAYTACGGISATVKIPKPSFYNLNVTKLSINGTTLPLPSDFQGSGKYSILDSCTSDIIVPPSVFQFLQDQIVGYFGLSNNFQANSDFDEFMEGNLWLSADESEFNWSKLPNISFTIDSGGISAYSSVTLVIGPRQYIQSDGNGKWSLMVKSFNFTTPYMILGLPFFSAYHIVLDRGNQEITFSPGCGCNTNDKYPLILIDNQFKYCQTSTAANTATTAAPSTTQWTCQSYTPWVPATASTTASPTEVSVAFRDRPLIIVNIFLAVLLSSFL